jgi:hypothetical protein
MEKHFTVHAATAQNVTLRLFSYPAWQIALNGKPAATQKTDVTGLIVIPIAAGNNDVYIHFRRTANRWIGNAVSLISLGLLIAVWIKTPPKMRLQQ